MNLTLRELRNLAPLEEPETTKRLGREAADEIARLRDALRVALAGLGRVSVRCMDTPTSPLKPYGDIARETLSTIINLIGPHQYDELALATLSQPPEMGISE